MKTSLNGFNSRLKPSEEKVGETEGGLIKISQRMEKKMITNTSVATELK